jgi:hypothetical protein
MIHIGLTQPESGREARARFTKQFFGTTVDGCSGQRVAEQLIDIVKISKK